MYLQKVLRKTEKNLFFVVILEVTDEKSTIQSRTKMSRIRNTGFDF